MVFRVDDNGVSVDGTTEVSMGGVGQGSVTVQGNFINKGKGKVNVDTRANLQVAGDIVNSAEFNIRDFGSSVSHVLIEDTIEELETKSPEARAHLANAYEHIKANEQVKAHGSLKLFVGYMQKHPELVTGGTQLILQALTMQS